MKIIIAIQRNNETLLNLNTSLNFLSVFMNPNTNTIPHGIKFNKIIEKTEKKLFSSEEVSIYFSIPAKINLNTSCREMNANRITNNKRTNNIAFFIVG
jgi:formylmethanofuran dehydrogenase subunit E